LSTGKARFKKPCGQIEEQSLVLIEHEILSRFRLRSSAANLSQHALGTFSACA
jgi:hypothetical protein